MKMRRKIGLALGGGGARDIAHLGVCQRLAELGVAVHCVAGTSIGAILALDPVRSRNPEKSGIDRS